MAKVTKKKTSKKAKGKKAATLTNALAAKIAFMADQCGLTTVTAADRSGGDGGKFKHAKVDNQVAKVLDGTLQFTKNNDPMILLKLEGIDGINDGVKHNEPRVLGPNKKEKEEGVTSDFRSFANAKADFTAMGLDWEEIISKYVAILDEHGDDIEKVHIEEVVDLVIILDVYTIDEHTNISIKSLAEIDDSEMGTGDDSVSTEVESEITADDINAMSDEDLEACAKAETDLTQVKMDDMEYDELRTYLIDELV